MLCRTVAAVVSAAALITAAPAAAGPGSVTAIGGCVFHDVSYVEAWTAYFQLTAADPNACRSTATSVSTTLTVSGTVDGP